MIADESLKAVIQRLAASLTVGKPDRVRDSDKGFYILVHVIRIPRKMWVLLIDLGELIAALL